MRKQKFIFVSGGVISGLGKGITTAAISLLLKSRGYKITPVKIDMYLNLDAGTIRPQEHGEVFVTADGVETDQDIGNYERFLNESLKRVNYITTGQIYAEVIRKERAFKYEGEDVEAIPHVTDEIIRRIMMAGKENKAEIIIIELGGTAGEYQNGIFFEALRILKLKYPNDVIHIHVSYLPVIKSLGELKSKPTQTSVHILNSMGIQPDFLVTRSESPIDQRRQERLALFCNLYDWQIIDNPDVASIYEVPLLLEKQNFSAKIIKKLKLKKSDKKDLRDWQKLISRIKAAQKEVKVVMVGKYFRTGSFSLIDSYISVIEALKHAGWENGILPKISWVDSEEIEKTGTESLRGYDGVIVPQGWGSRGTEGKIKTAQFARENKIPYLGLCFGMQMAVIDFARQVCGLTNANSAEVNPKTKHPVIHIMADQKKYLEKHQYGGTIRLGNWPCRILSGTKLSKAYGKTGIILERHRHRYEFNNRYRQVLEKAGLIVSGISPDGELVEAIELKEHPFFIGTQFHPEYQSRPLAPHPLFSSFLKACLREKKGEE